MGIIRPILNPTARMNRHKLFLYITLLLLSLAGFGEVAAQQVFKTTPTSVIGFLEYLPEQYQNNSDKYPVVIFLHGKGEKGPDGTNPTTLATGVPKLTRLGPPKHVKNGVQFPFILISPQLKSSFGDWQTWYVMEVINYVKTYLRVDERRIYLTGLSLGGGGVWWTAQDLANEFAAIAPVCGSRNSKTKAHFIADEDLPVWGFHGDKDPTVPLARTRDMVNAINVCQPSPNPRAKITVYPGVKHNAWDNAYQPNHSVHNPNVYEWMLSFTNTKNGNNAVPIANAGADVQTSAASATLKGSGSDADGNITSYTWKQISGPSGAKLTNPGVASTTVTGLKTGTYIFRLQVTDNKGERDADYVRVLVKAGGNSAPIANAGADKTLTLPTKTITLSGSAQDTDGTIASYTWSKVSGGAATLSGTTTTKLTASGLQAGTYVFRLTVKDNQGATGRDDVTVVVKDAAVSTTVVVNAGPDKLITVPSSTVTVKGTATPSPGGKIVSYQWVQVYGKPTSLAQTRTNTLSISGVKTAGTRVYKLVAVDNQGKSALDHVKVEFKTKS